MNGRELMAIGLEIGRGQTDADEGLNGARIPDRSFFGRRAPSFASHIGLRTGLLDLRRLERLDVFKTVDDAAADLEIPRPLLEPAPPFKSPRADVPAPRQVDLVEMSDGSVGARTVGSGSWRGTCGDGAGCHQASRELCAPALPLGALLDSSR